MPDNQTPTRGVRDTAAILRLAASVNSPEQLADLLVEACRVIVELLAVDHSGIVVFSPDGASGRLIAEYPPKLAADEIAIPVRGVPAETALLRGVGFKYSDLSLATDLGIVREVLMGIGIKSILVEPVICDHKVVASFSVDSIEASRQFGPEEEEICKSFASMLGVAYGKIAHLEAERKRAETSDTLREAILDLSSDLRPDVVLQKATRQAKELLGCRNAGVYLYDYDRQELRIASAYHHIDTLLDRVLVKGEGMSGRLVMPDAPRFLRTADYQSSEYLANVFASGHPFGAVLTARIPGRQRLFGTLFVDDAKGREFTDDEAEMMCALAEQIGPALQTAYQVARKESGLQLLLKATRLVAEADSLAGLNQLAELIVKFLRVSFCRVIVVEPDVGRLRPVAAACVKRSEPFSWKPGLETSKLVSEQFEIAEVVLQRQFKHLRWVDSPSQPALQRLSEELGLVTTAQSVLWTPLISSGKFIGVLEIGELRQESRSPLTVERRKLVLAVARQTATLVDRVYKVENERVRSQRIGDFYSMARHLIPELQIGPLLDEILRLATKTFASKYAYLFVPRRSYGRIDLHGCHGAIRGPLTLPAEDEFVGKSARIGTVQLLRQPSKWPPAADLFPANIQTLVAAPLKVGASVEAVLVLPDLELSRNSAASLDIEILDRLVRRSSSTLATAYTISPKARTERVLRALQPILLYSSRCHDFRKITRAFLSGLTAAYGLRLNRAVLLMCDSYKTTLNGTDAVGEVTLIAAEQAWKDFDHEFDDFGKLAIRLESGPPPPFSALGERIETLRIPVNRSGVLEYVLDHKLPALITPSDLTQLPQPLLEFLSPETEVLVLPLLAGGDSIGLVVADNRFTRARITESDIDIAMQFTTSASPSLQNTLLFGATNQAARWSAKTHVSAQLLLTSDTHEEVTDRLKQSVGAQGVGVILCNPAGEVIDRFASGNARKELSVRSNGISVQVIASGTAWITFDAQQETRMNTETLLPDDRAMACMPMWDHGHVSGVVWLSFDEPREFEPAEIEHFQQCVNSAASIYRTASNRRAATQLVATTQKAAGRADLLDVTTAIVQYARASFGAGSATFWPWDADSNRFLPQSLVSDGIPSEDEEYFRANEPRPEHITYKVLELGYYPVSDVDAEPLAGGLAERLKHAGIQSFGAVALEACGEKFGVLYVSYPYKRSFGRSEQIGLTSFAAYASWLIVTTRQSRRSGMAQRLAYKTAREFALGTNYQATLETICKYAIELYDCTNVVLFRYDESSNKLICPPTVDGHFKDPEYMTQCGSLEPDSWLLALLDNESPVIEEEVDKHEFYQTKRFAREEQVKTFIAIRLRARGRTVGLLFINFDRSHRVAEYERQDVQLLADFAAIAVHNAQHHLNMANFSMALLGCASEKEVLKVGGREAARLMGTPMSNIVLAQPDGGLLVESAYGWDGAIDKYRMEPGYLSHSAYTLQKGEAVWVDDFALEKRFEVPEAIRSKGIRSGLSALLRRDGRPAGVLLVHTQVVRQFRELDVYLLEALGNQIAQALERARHFETSEAKRANIEALNESSRAIIRSIRDLDTEKVYDAILEQAVRAVNGKADLATLLLFDPNKEELSPAAIYPRDRDHELRARIGNAWSTSTGHPLTGKIGIAGWALAAKEAQLVDDVSAEAAQRYYVELSKTTRSNLAIPLLAEHNRPVGVLNVESDQVGAFDLRDRDALQSLALVMVIVLQVGRKHQEVLKARGEAKARLVLAWLGFAANHGWHSSRAHLATIQGAALNIRQELAMRLGASVPEQVVENLRLVEFLCKEMLNLDLAPPLDSHEARGSISVNEFLAEFSAEVENRRDRCFEVQRQFAVSDGVQIRVNAAWFRCAINILVDNAARELKHVEESRRVLRLISRPSASCIEIIVEDHGRGIPEEVQGFLGKKVVPGAMGVGVGYLIAQAVAETYDGTLTFETGYWGTRMIIGLPAFDGRNV